MIWVLEYKMDVLDPTLTPNGDCTRTVRRIYRWHVGTIEVAEQHAYPSLPGKWHPATPIFRTWAFGPLSALQQYLHREYMHLKRISIVYSPTLTKKRDESETSLQN